jgi:hypothetical protein
VAFFTQVKGRCQAHHATADYADVHFIVIHRRGAKFAEFFLFFRQDLQDYWDYFFTFPVSG